MVFSKKLQYVCSPSAIWWFNDVFLYFLDNNGEICDTGVKYCTYYDLAAF